MPTLDHPAPTTGPGTALPLTDIATVRADLGLAPSDESLTTHELVHLLGARGPALRQLMRVAAHLRDEGLRAAGRPGIITYSRKVFVPLTTLCRDRCHYCIFVDTPGQLQRVGKPVYMSPEQVLKVVRAGERQGCKEALLTLGDRPEERWPDARAWLDRHGYRSTLDYVAHIARLIRTETGLLPHLNPGVMSADELTALRPTAPSMGMMLETTSRRLYEEPGQVHFGSPDKDPRVRLQVIDDAGSLRIPFTTGILVGIGETLTDRAESLQALRRSHDRFGHLQEVIVQNFRAKPRTAMRSAPDAEHDEYLAAVAVARLVMGARMRIQVPPNLSDAAELADLLAAGADDWGGVSPVTADHVNPERPWPHLDDLARHTAAHGFELRERLTAHPEYVHERHEWIDPQLYDAVAALADSAGLAASSTEGASAARPRADTATAAEAPRAASHTAAAHALVDAAANDPSQLGADDWERLLTLTGSDLEHLVATADDARRYSVGESVSIVTNRNLTSTGLRPRRESDPATFTLDDVAAIARDADDLGATEICVQGLIPGPPEGYLDIVREIRRARPSLHVHAYRPQDVWDFARRTHLPIDAAYRTLAEAGVGTVPGTGVKILSERVRARIAPTDVSVDEWIAAIRAAHAAGLRSSSVLFYGHVETAAERIAHLGTLRDLHRDTGGFTEFVPIPLPTGGVPLVDGRAPVDEHRAMMAVSRLFLAGTVAHLQVPWPRHSRATVAALLRAGADDLGGTLYDGRVHPGTGVEHGATLSLTDAETLAARLFRTLRRRTTDYREVAT